MTALLEAEGLTVRFALPRESLFGPRKVLEAVRGVSFALDRGRTLGLVGESGSGKTTAAMAAIRLAPVAAGEVRFEGQALTGLEGEALRRRRADMQVIFQDPYSSLNPRARVGEIVAEPLELQGMGDAASRRDRARELFGLVGLRPDQLALFPHQFSGGQRQRVSIARALATNPKLVVCDEPVSALDVAIQAQILNLLRRLQEELGLGYLFISHDLGVVRQICDDVAVMYLGKIVEQAPRAEIFARPRHPYTRALLEAAPSLAWRKSQGGPRRSVRLKGDPPSPIDPPPGCAFAPRCPRAQAVCSERTPVLEPVGGSRVACFFPD